MQIYEISGTDEVMVGGMRIEGFIDEGKCTKCDNYLIYFGQYDSYFCAYCNDWKEENCGDTDCMFCKNRPDFPLKLNE